MNHYKAQSLAKALMLQHLSSEWHFEFDNAKRRFGCCKYRTKTISLSYALVRLNEEDEVRDTILHEIAHAMVGHGHGHDYVWRRQLLAIGGNGKRCYDSTQVAQPKAKYTLTCPNCGTETGRYKLTRRLIVSPPACSKCCNSYNGGRYSDKFKFIVKPNY